MKQEETFVRMIKDKLEEDRPTYDPAYWERAEAQIRQWEAEDEPRKRPLLWWWLGGLMVLLAGSATAYFTFNETVGSHPAVHYAARTTMPKVPQPVDEGQAAAESSDPQGRGQASKSSSLIASIRSNAQSGLVKPLGQGQQFMTEPNGLQANEDQFIAEASPMIKSITPKAIKVAKANHRSSHGVLLNELASRYGAWNLGIGPLNVTGSHQEVEKRWRLRVIAGVDVQPIAQATEAGTNAFSGVQGTIGALVSIPSGLPITLETGLQYAQYSLSNVQLSSTGTTYNFGATEEVLTWTPEQVQEFQLPVRLLVPVLPKQHLSVGGGLHYIWGTSGTAQTETTDLFGQSQTSSETYKGITYGVNRLGASIQLGYEWEVSPTFRVGLRYQQALRDLTDNEVFGEQNDRSRHLRLIFTYQLR